MILTRKWRKVILKRRKRLVVGGDDSGLLLFLDNIRGDFVGDGDGISAYSYSHSLAELRNRRAERLESLRASPASRACDSRILGFLRLLFRNVMCCVLVYVYVLIYGNFLLGYDFLTVGETSPSWASPPPRAWSKTMATKQKVEQTTTDAPATPAEPEKLLTVKAGQKYRGARQAWYERMVTLEGKSRKDVEADLEANPPALYGPRSKFAGKPEPVSGWVRFFERTGVAEFK